MTASLTASVLSFHFLSMCSLTPWYLNKCFCDTETHNGSNIHHCQHKRLFISTLKIIFSLKLTSSFLSGRLYPTHGTISDNTCYQSKDFIHHCVTPEELPPPAKCWREFFLWRMSWLHLCWVKTIFRVWWFYGRLQMTGKAIIMNFRWNIMYGWGTAFTSHGDDVKHSK